MSVATEGTPDGWTEVSVGEIVAPGPHSAATGPFGSSIGSRFFRSSGVPVIRGGNLSADTSIRLRDSNLVFLTKEKAAEFPRSTVRRGDLVFTCWGTINQVGLIDEGAAYPEYVISNKQMKLTPNRMRASSEFLYFLFSAPAMQREILNGTIGSSIPGFNLTRLRSLRILLPPVTEQVAIAEALSYADQKVRAVDRLIAKKQAIKQGMMQQLLTGKTRLPGCSADWISVSWGEVTERCVSGATPLRSRDDFYGGEIPWVTSTELKYGRITQVPQTITAAGLAAANLKVWPEGTFLMAITGLEAAGTRGSCGLLGMPAATNQSCMAIVHNNRLSTGFLYYFYLLHGEDLALRYCQGTKQQSYTAGIVRTLPMFLPTDVGEQRAIANILADMDDEIDILRSRLVKAKAFKQGMMQELLTGRIRLPVTEAVA